MDGKSRHLRARRNELERELLALVEAIEAQPPPQWWESSPHVHELSARATELLRQLSAVNNEILAMGAGPASDQA